MVERVRIVSNRGFMLAAFLGVAISDFTPALAGLVEVVDWGGNYVSNDPEWFNGTITKVRSGNDTYTDPDHEILTPNSSVRGRIPTESEVYNPTDYTKYSGISDIYYGGHAVQMNTTLASNGGMSKLNVENSGTQDYMQVDVNPDVKLQRFAMLTYWRKTEFLGGGPNKTLSLDSSSVFSLATTQDAGPKPAGHSLRWVVRQNNIFYFSSIISESLVNNDVYTTVGAGSLAWYSFGALPTSLTGLTGLFFDERASEDPVSTPLKNLDAVGFYVQYDRPEGANGAEKVLYKITDFNVTLNSVPEPGTFVLGLVGFGGVAARRWRQRRKAAAAEGGGGEV